jgi:putative ABC transport system permease protein
MLVTLSITVGLFAVGMIIHGYVIVTEDMAMGFQAINPADLHISTQGFDENLIERVRRVDGVVLAEGKRLLFMQMLTVGGEWQNLTIQVLPEGEQHINRIELIDGRLPEEREIALDIHLEVDYVIGDLVTVQTPSGLRREIPLSGSVRDQTIGMVGGNYFVAPTYGYITYETLPYLHQDSHYTVLLVRLAPELTPEGVEVVQKEITAVIEHSGRSVTSIINLRPAAHPNYGYVDAVAGLLALLGFLSVFLSGFLVFNAMSALFAQQIRHIGIMKAIGAQRTDIIYMYMAFIFVFGLLALVIAIPLAAWASAELAEFLALRLNYPDNGFRYVSEALIAQAVIALVLPQAAGFIPILRASKISVNAAITTTGIKVGDFGKSPIDRLIGKFKSIGRPLMISLRNTFRRKSRLILTLITLSLGGAVFIATFNVRASIETHIEQVSKYLLADVSLDFERNYRINDVTSLAQSVIGVQGLEPRAMASCQLLNADGDPAESVEMLGAPPDSALIEPLMLGGRWIILGDENAIVLNEAFLVRYPDLKVGDSITLRVNRRDLHWTVVGFFQFIGGDYLMAYVPLDYLNQVTGNLNRAANFQIVATPEVIAAGLEDDLALRLDDAFRQGGYAIRRASTSQSLLENAAMGLDTLTIFLLIMSGLTALVGSISLTGVMGMNVMERTREIGVMRAIGATDRQVMNLVIIEGVIVGLISWVFGGLAAIPISSVMSNIINMAVFGVLGRTTFTGIGLVIWLGAVILLSIVASFIPARNAARLTIREVLAYE